MLNSNIINQVLSIADDRSGDHAQDGFDFQASTAIYLMFIELEQKNEFSLVYEKVDDFIIFVDDIRIYQSKSTSKGLTDSVLSKGEPIKLTKGSKKSNNLPMKLNNSNPKPKTGLSIIEKLQKNMDVVTKTALGTKVKAHLLWNKDYKFGTSLLKGTNINTDSTKLILSDVSDSVKQKIIKDTGLSKYDWSQIEIIRLLSKKDHELFTCKHIEDVIYKLIGPNTSYSNAFYASVLNQIRINRKTKEAITSQFLLTEIHSLKNTPSAPRPNEYQHLLSGVDFGNYIIHSNVREVFLYQSIEAHPLHQALKQIEFYIDLNYTKIVYPSNLYNELKKQPEFDELLLIYSAEKIKALIVNAFLNKER